MNNVVLQGEKSNHLFTKVGRYSLHVLIFLSFLITFFVARTLVYLQIYGAVPQIFPVVNGAHIHHFAYGVFLLALCGYLSLTFQNSSRSRLLAIFFGVGLGLTFDEFGMWFYLEDSYWTRQTYDAIIIVSIALFNFVFLRQFRQTFKIHLINLVAQDPGNIAQRDTACHLPVFRNRFPGISVVIPAYNEERFIIRTLKSLAVQEYPGIFEVIVVDNGSTDRTGTIARQFGARVVFESTRGVGLAREVGFRAARAQIIATTDADTVVPKDWLAVITARFNEHSKLVAFGGLYRFTHLGLMPRFLAGTFLGLIFQIDKIFSGGSLPGANMAVRRSAWKKIGGFSTTLRLGEDSDLATRLCSLGKIVLDPQFVVFTSGRRFLRQGFWGAFFSYMRNGIPRMLFQKHFFADLPVIREETSRPFSFRAMCTTMIAVFVLVFISFLSFRVLPAHAHIQLNFIHLRHLHIGPL